VWTVLDEMRQIRCLSHSTHLLNIDGMVGGGDLEDFYQRVLRTREK
jgi:hypothetical protein